MGLWHWRRCDTAGVWGQVGFGMQMMQQSSKKETPAPSCIQEQGGSKHPPFHAPKH